MNIDKLITVKMLRDLLSIEPDDAILAINEDPIRIKDVAFTLKEDVDFDDDDVPVFGEKIFNITY